VHAAVTEQITAAAARSYDTLKASHLRDYQALFNRVVLNLDESTPTIPTNELQKSYNGGTYDPFLDVLYYQYGRYLLISSSRGMALPANLQGLWNDSNDPPWQCDIHSNINVQMNYWPAEVANLPECHMVFLDYIYNEAMGHGSWKGLASATGNAGWTIMVQNNIFGYGDWKYTRPANAWYAMHLWQHYSYSQDKDFLSSRAYPVMKSACDFWISRLKTDSDGSLVAPGEWSPEQGPESEDGVTYAQTLIWDLFTNTIKASAILNEDATYRGNLQDKLDKLDKGLRVGSWGQLREWKYTNDDRANTHRHISHLIGLYPGKQISPLIDTKYSDAAKVSLDARGDVGPGWSRAWKIAVRARLFDGNHALTLVKNALQNATVTVVDMANGGGAYENLLDAHPPFQIDGNFGATAGMTEMLLQSQLDQLVLLPAPPDAWPKGSVSGICAEGGFEVGIAWEQRKVTTATIKSKSGMPCTLKNPMFGGDFFVVDAADSSAVTYTRTGDSITFDTSAGATYRIGAGTGP
jgi:alpha-L-fucosidase 2